MKLTQREIDILGLIVHSRNDIDVKEMSKKLDLTVEQFKYALEKINRYLRLKNRQVIQSERGKVHLSNRYELKEEYNFLISHTTPDIFRYSTEQIQQYIFLKLLISEEPVPIGYFVKTLNTSRTTVVNSLSIIEKTCEEELIHFRHILRQGYQIQGYSYKRFFLFIEVLLKLINIRELYGFYYKDMIYSKAGELIFFEMFELDTLFEAIDETIEFSSKTENLDDTSFLLLMVLKYKYFELDKLDLSGDNKDKLEILRHFLYELENNEQLDLENRQLGERLILGINHELSKKLGVTLRFSEASNRAVYKHVERMIFRVKNGVDYQDVETKSLIEGYEELFTIMETAIKKFGEGQFYRISQSEIVLLTLYYISELEKASPKYQKAPRVLIICAEGRAVSTILKKRIANFVDSKMIHTSSVFEFENSYIDYYDLVITTVPLLEVSDEKIIYLENIFEDDVIEKIKKKMRYSGHQMINQNLGKFSGIMEAIYEETEVVKDLSRLETRILKILTSESMTEMISEKHQLVGSFIFDETLVTYHKQRHTFQQAIFQSAQGLLEKASIQQSYIDKIISNAEQFGNYMMVLPGILLAHAGEEDGVIENGFSISMFKQAVQSPETNDYPINIIMVVAMNRHEFYPAIERIIQWISSTQTIATLSNEENKSTIAKTIKSLLVNEVQE
ncbi:hypothetical protein IGI37_003002 [Enterococcus sp. AZ194]|uniref:BglG family transcription antiterminator n=1 Tax=Enterococcus sp. AZ194 TaxID=2774629 RepID=UPI003F2486F2